MSRMREWKQLDWILLSACLAIFILGLFCLYSASYQKSLVLGRSLAWQQVLWMGVSLLLVMGLLSHSYLQWMDWAYPFYGLTIFLLIVVLAVGEIRLGAQRWLDIGLVSFQPSELAKLATVLVLARTLSNHRPQGRFFQDLGLPVFLSVIPMGLILKQPDLGTALTFIPLCGAMLLIWGARLRHLAWISGGGLLASPLAWHVLKEYQRKRLLVFLNPSLDPLGAGYTIIQSKIAIGSGGLFGKGWLAGTQNQLNFLPERHTDFIFSVIGEEWGFVGALIFLSLFTILIWRGFWIVQKTTHHFGQLLATGAVVLLAFQVVVNVGMTMGLLPVVGLPLPFVSYGGTALVTNMLCLGILLNVGLYKPFF